MRALDRLPGVELRGAELRLFVRMPADAGGRKNYLRAAKRGNARAFRIPLVPADLHANFALLCLEIGEAESAGSEIKFFLVQRLVGNVDLSVLPDEAAVGIENGAGVVAG